MSNSKMLPSRQRAVALPLLAAPEGSLMQASLKLSGLLLVWLVMTSVSGDVHTDLPHPGETWHTAGTKRMADVRPSTPQGTDVRQHMPPKAGGISLDQAVVASRLT